MRYFTYRYRSNAAKNKLQEACIALIKEHSDRIIESTEEVNVLVETIQEQVKQKNEEFNRCKPEKCVHYTPQYKSDPSHTISVGDFCSLVIYQSKN